MHSKRQQVLDKLADRCLQELENGVPDTELLRLYLEHSAEAAAGTTASDDMDVDWIAEKIAKSLIRKHIQFKDRDQQDNVAVHGGTPS
jgi:hypothetical protein